jgi:hypothetical protein
MPNTRQVPSASCTKAGPPESPWQLSLPPPPIEISLLASMPLIVVVTWRLIP